MLLSRQQRSVNKDKLERSGIDVILLDLTSTTSSSFISAKLYGRPVSKLCARASSSWWENWQMILYPQEIVAGQTRAEVAWAYYNSKRVAWGFEAYKSYWEFWKWGYEKDLGTPVYVALRSWEEWPECQIETFYIRTSSLLYGKRRVAKANRLRPRALGTEER